MSTTLFQRVTQYLQMCDKTDPRESVGIPVNKQLIKIDCEQQLLPERVNTTEPCDP
jgi:hypothetical protein